jgi:hypothetical protein
MVWLVEALTRPGEIVLDCFCGLGATLLAAQRLGRPFVGCDISRPYCKITLRRLRAAKAELAKPRVGPANRHDDRLNSAKVKDGTATPQWLFGGDSGGLPSLLSRSVPGENGLPRILIFAILVAEATWSHHLKSRPFGGTIRWGRALSRPHAGQRPAPCPCAPRSGNAR